MKAWKISLLVFVSLTLISLAVLITTTVPILRATLQAMSAALNRDHGVELKFTDLRIEGLSTVQIDGAQFRTADGGVVIRAKTLRASLSLWGYLFDGVPIDQIELIEPDVFVRPSHSSKGIGWEAPTFSLNRISVVDARLQIENPDGSIVLKRLNANLARRKRQYEVQIDAGTIDVVGGKFNYTLKAAETQFEIAAHELWNPKSIKLSRLFIATNEGEIELKGQASKSQFFGELRSSRLNIDNNWLGPIIANVVADRHGVEVRGAQVRFGATPVNIDARIEFGRAIKVAYAVSARQLSLYDLLDDLDVKNAWIDLIVNADVKGVGELWPHFKLKAHAVGTAHDLIVTKGSARANPHKPLILRGVNSLAFDGNWIIDAESFNFLNTHVSDGVSSGDVECSLYFDKKRGLKLHGDFTQMDFASIAFELDDNHFEGIGRAQVDIFGPYERLTIDAHGEVASLAFEHFALGQVAARVHYRDDVLSFDQAKGTIGSSNYAGALSFDFSGVTKMKLSAQSNHANSQDLREAIPVSRLRDLPWSEPIQFQAFVEGPIEKGHRLGLQGHAWLRSPHADVQVHANQTHVILDRLKVTTDSGSLNAVGEMVKRSQTAHIDVETNGVEILGVRLGDAHIQALLQDQNWQVSGHYQSGRGRLKLQGQNSLSGKFSGSTDLQFMSLTDVFSTWDWPQGLDVSAGAHAEVSGQWNEWDSLTGRFVLYPAVVNYAGLKLLSKDPISVRFHGSKLDIERLTLGTSHGDYWKVSGGLDGFQGHFRLQMRGDLWLLPFLSERIETGYGDWFADVTMTGDIRNPSWQGSVKVEHGFVTFPDYLSPVENLTLSAQLNGHRIDLTELSGQVKKGQFEGNGYVIVKGYAPDQMNLGFQFEQVPFHLSTWMMGTGSGKLRLSGPRDALTLSGNVQILDGLVSRDIDWEEAASNLNFAPPVIDLRRGVVKPLALDVQLSSEGIVIDNNALSAKLTARLHVLGNKESPGLRGSVNLLSGDAYFKGHHYRLLKARADFDDPYRIWPIFHVEAESRIDDYDVMLRLQGTVDHPQVQLSSSPSLPEQKVLNLVMLGYTGYETGSGMASSRAAGIEAFSAYSNVGQKLINLFPRNMNRIRLLSLDELRLTSLFSKTGGVSLPAVLMGVEVWRGVRLRLQSTLIENDSGSREQRLELEQNFLRGLRWRAVWDSEGQSNYGDAGLDLWYRWEF